MRIALISYEFPPDTAFGGIASYTHETARMLASGGHDVEVFCAGHTARSVSIENGVLVHTVPDLDKDRFAESLLPVFSARHAAHPFDVAESPEIYGDARAVRRAFPGLPLLVKLHTPTFLCSRLNRVPLTFAAKLRFAFGALRRGRLAWLKPDRSVMVARYNHESSLYRDADAVISPSRDLARIVQEEWGARPEGVGHVPNPYSPPSALLELPPAAPRLPLLYIGQLQMRKGVSDLVEALALLEKQGHAMSARFVGHPFPSPRANLNMAEWGARLLPVASGRYAFTGRLTREASLAEFAAAGLVVLPSRWEAFGYTCLEAMAAGRVVIGSAAGGMAEIIEPGVSGLLIPPRSPRTLAATLLEILNSPHRCADIGANARRRVLSAYSPQAILPLQIAAYERTIRANRARRGA